MSKVSVALGILIIHPAAQYDPMDLIQFVQKNLVPLNAMMERSGMSEMNIFNRTRDVFLHFNLPYDAPQSEE